MFCLELCSFTFPSCMYTKWKNMLEYIHLNVFICVRGKSNFWGVQMMMIMMIMMMILIPITTPITIQHIFPHRSELNVLIRCKRQWVVATQSGKHTNIQTCTVKIVRNMRYFRKGKGLKSRLENMWLPSYGYVPREMSLGT